MNFFHRQLLLLSILSLFQLSGCAQSHPIFLHPNQVASITNRGESNRLVDAQDTKIINSGDPLPGLPPWDQQFQENGLNRSFIGAFNDGNIYQNAVLYFPLEIVIDLEATLTINKICLADLNGEGKISIARLTDNHKWEFFLNTKLDKSFQWNCYEDVSPTTQYLKIICTDPSANIGEIRLFSKSPISQKKQASLAQSKKSLPTMKSLMGVNINTEDPVYQLSLFEFVREYHDWHLEMGDHDPNDCQPYRWNPSNAYEGWSFDKIYDDITDAGVTIAADLKGNIPALEKYTREDKPLRPGADPEVAASYTERAEYFYQFSARYGRQKQPLNTLVPRVEEKAVSGLNLVHYIEDWNEQDKYWMGKTGSEQQRAAYFTPFEYAAMLSANYDGHENTLLHEPTENGCNKPTPVGVRTADPSMKVVMSGITGIDLDYVKGIYSWAKLNRKDQAFPADVLNFHHYSNNFGGQSGGPTRNAIGVSPEEDDLYGRLKTMVNYRDQYLPGKEVWLSEFGYDVHSDSPQRVPIIRPFDRETVQGQWLVRSFLVIAAAGVDKAQLFTFTDDYKGNPAQRFSTCGLLELAKEQNYSTPFPEFRARKAYYFLYAMKTVLRDYYFQNIIPTQDKKINVYLFCHQDNDGRKVYAVWANTSNNYRKKNFGLTVGNQAKRAAQITLLDKDLDGKRQSLKLLNGTVRIPEVTETPTFIVVNEERPDFEKCAWNIPITPDMIKLEGSAKWGNPATLVDEPYLLKSPGTLRQPICGNGGVPIEAWMNAPGEDWPKREVAAIIDLKTNHYIKGLSLFDSISQGWLRLEYGQPGNWKTLDRYHTTKYNEWKSWLNLDIETRYLRIILEDRQAVVNELVVLGWTL